MFKMRRPSPPPRNGNEGAAARLSSALFRMRGVLSAPAEGRAVRAEGGPALLPAGLREGDVPDAAGQLRRRRPARREQQAAGRPPGAQATPHHPDVGAAAPVQGLVRGQPQALPQSAGGAGQGDGPQRAGGPGLVPEPEGQDEEDPAQGEAGRRQVARRQGQGGQGRQDHQAGVAL